MQCSNNVKSAAPSPRTRYVRVTLRRPFSGIDEQISDRLYAARDRAPHDNNIICLSALYPPSRSLAPVECVARYRLVGEAWLEFWKTALNRSDR